MSALEDARIALAGLDALKRASDEQTVALIAAGLNLEEARAMYTADAVANAAVAIAEGLLAVNETLGHLVDVVVEAAAGGPS